MWNLLYFSSFFILSLAINEEGCGKKPPQRPWGYIVGGRDADKEAWPWQLSLQYRKDDGTWGHTCGATLIEPGWALTAAHCTYGRNEDVKRFRIIAGAHNIKESSGAEQTVDVDLIIEHNRFLPFPPFGFPNDIGLLRLAKPVDMTQPNVNTACIPDESDGNFANGTADCWITGWGKTFYNNADIPAILQEAYIRVPTNLQCRLWYNYILRASHICAGTGYPAGCAGDSGGPMSCQNHGDDKYYVAGSTSFGPFFCFMFPTVYTRTSSFYSWIETNIQNNAITHKKISHMAP